MPSKSSLRASLIVRPPSELRLPRFIQISESHCGPAVIQMLLGHLGIEVTQEDVAEAGGATQLIELHGMRVDQLAQAVKQLSPAVTFWFKEHATIAELTDLVNQHHYPVGVEWQGLFEDEEEEEDEDDEEDDDDEDDDDDSETGDDDYGHYSIITYLDEKNELLIIVDPYKDFANQDRIFSFEEFDERWWDYNEVSEPQNGRSHYAKDDHMLFIVTPKDETFPHDLGMIPVL